MSNLDERLAQLGDEAEAGEADQAMRPLPPQVKVSRPGRARSKVLQVRLNPDELAALEAIADRRELPVSTVAREQILRLLADDGEDGPNPLGQLLDAAERVNEIAHEVRRHLGPKVTYRR